MGHSHHHNHGDKNLGITVLLNLFITIAQIFGGIISGSMALISDAAHNFSDVLSLMISWFAKKIAHKEASEKYTFGLKRIEIFAAFTNSITLLIIGIIIFYAAVRKIFNPAEIDGNMVIYLAGLSILVNGLSVLFIKKDADESINIKSAYLHLLTDMFTSIAVLIGGLVIKFTDFLLIDSILSIVIALFLVFSSVKIIVKAIKIFMEFSPEGVDLQEIVQKVSALENVKNIHHIHLWQLSDKSFFFEAHIDLSRDVRISEFDDIQKEIAVILCKYNINHYNLQPEWGIADDKRIISDIRDNH